MTNNINSKKQKIALGLSGGVDSAVCAHLLVEQGYQVETIFLECWNKPGCRTDQDRKDALAVALQLDLPFQVIDFKQAYRDQVLSYFLDSYRAGRTPNPDIICNREIKFGLFYQWAMSEGFDAIATGHYAKIIKTNNSLQLAIPTDTHKDQTYFLSQINQDQLQNIFFPLSNLTKEEVRQLAHSYHLKNADKKDSVGICFIGDINVGQFLKEQLGENPGDVVDKAGNTIGFHRGLWFYTIGQRHGFTINQTRIVKSQSGELVTKHNIPPFYVINKNSKLNQLVVGFGEETKTHSFVLDNLHWIDPKVEPNRDQQLYIRIRHGGELLPCQITPQSKNVIKVSLQQPTAGVSTGQFGVTYQAVSSNQQQEVICLGGGEISLQENC